MTELLVFGIPNCDTVKKARAWLAERGQAYRFHDYKKDGIDAGRLAKWAEATGWEALLNRRGTTFRALSEEDKAAIDRAKALRLMAQHPSLIKRPVAEHGSRVLVGFDPAVWGEALG